MQRPITRAQSKYIEDALTVEELNGFNRNKVWSETAQILTRFIDNIQTIHNRGAISYRKIANELGISEKSLYRYMKAQNSYDLRTVPFLAVMYSFDWADYLKQNPTAKAKKRDHRRKYQERHNRPVIKVVKGS